MTVSVHNLYSVRAELDTPNSETILLRVTSLAGIIGKAKVTLSSTRSIQGMCRRWG